MAVGGEEHGASAAQTSGEHTRTGSEDPGASGWTTTKQAAKVLGVSRRSVQGYVSHGLLEAIEEGKGVNRRFLISIDSLNALVERRRGEGGDAANFAGGSPTTQEPAMAFANAGEGLRHLVERLEARTAEATELRIRLELTERAQSTLEEERMRALEELADERRRREAAGRERDELRRHLESREDAPESTEPRPGTPTGASEGAQEGTEGPRRSWWREFFGFD